MLGFLSTSVRTCRPRCSSAFFAEEMAGISLRLCRFLLQAGKSLRTGYAVSSALRLTPARFRSDSVSPSDQARILNAAKTVSKSEGDGVFPASPPLHSSLNEAELAKFAAIAETWWDLEGPFKPLHLINPARVSFIRSALCRYFRKNPLISRPFEGLKIIDVGCGGGILSEPIARMGACVTGIDAGEKNINVARLHAELDSQNFIH
ncbi:hypothetical protein HPP92_000522 [Vanilla planifolia]|uniref:Methyltransferase domain-containing protein n=1 Tax=Vanilla planifolia TaxID=51239 RepID=A0A835RXM4_VANPL|nr:hypothetical protein HPP92_000522 [Vanilla planifolia]